MRDAKKYQRYNDVKPPIDAASSGGDPSSVVDNESVKMSDSVSQHTPKQYVVPDVDDWLNEEKQREHEETIKAGVRIIFKIRFIGSFILPFLFCVILVIFVNISCNL